jgi:hypothetical protein
MHSTGVPVCKDEVRAVRGGFGRKGWSPRGSEEEEEASEEAEPRGVGECSRVAWVPPRRQTENRAWPPSASEMGSYESVLGAMCWRRLRLGGAPTLGVNG